MYSFGLYCDECQSSYVIHVASVNPGTQECRVCGSLLTEVVDYGIRHAWRTEVLAHDGDTEAELIERIRAVFGPGVEELESGQPAGRALGLSRTREQR